MLIHGPRFAARLRTFLIFLQVGRAVRDACFRLFSAAVYYVTLCSYSAPLLGCSYGFPGRGGYVHTLLMDCWLCRCGRHVLSGRRRHDKVTATSRSHLGTRSRVIFLLPVHACGQGGPLGPVAFDFAAVPFKVVVEMWSAKLVRFC